MGSSQGLSGSEVEVIHFSALREWNRPSYRLKAKRGAVNPELECRLAVANFHYSQTVKLARRIIARREKAEGRG